MTDFLDDRRRALEEVFFAKRNQALLEQLRADIAAKKKKESLSAVSGITDDQVLSRLLDLNLDAETLAALTLVPLILVAWSDGSVADAERHAVLAAAAKSGIAMGSGAYELLVHWLEESVPPNLHGMWSEYVAALCKRLDPAARAALKADVLDRARAVAQAAGGILGIHTISASEQDVLTKLGAAFQ